MASKLLGRCTCPLQCGHTAAHVKLKTDKAEGKAALPYAYCPGCGVMMHTKTEEQARALAALTRPEKTEPAPVPVHTPTPTGKTPPVDEPEPVRPPPPKPTPTGWLTLFAGSPA